MELTDGHPITLEVITRLKNEKRMELQLSQKRLKESFTTLVVCPDKGQDVSLNPLMMEFNSLFPLIQGIGVAIKFIRKCKKMFVGG